MDLDFIRRDTWALQNHFKLKRDFLLTELAKIGITVLWEPTATFYIWADLSGLPSPLNDWWDLKACILCYILTYQSINTHSFLSSILFISSLVFLEECVKHNVICVPGVFFDINPREIRHLQKSKCINFVRFSYGPPMRNLTLGVEQMGKMISYWRHHQMSAEQYGRESFHDT